MSAKTKDLWPAPNTLEMERELEETKDGKQRV
jgi:hypothetical protein